MKWFLFMHCKVLLLILLGYFSPIDTRTILSNSIEKYSEDFNQTTKNKQYVHSQESNELEDISAESENNIESMNEEEAKYLEELMATTANPTTVKPGFQLIFPGTKWCGDGNIATSYDDLGEKEETDKCCRDHDNCDDFILAGETKYNLTNKTPYTSLSCECDRQLFECLLQANTSTSTLVGTIYFNIAGKACFDWGYPEKCTKHIPLVNICYKYETDTNERKAFQWIPPKKFKRL